MNKKNVVYADTWLSWGRVYTTPKEFEKEVLNLKDIIVSRHTTPEEFESPTIISDVIVFKKAPFKNFFSSTLENTKPAFSNSSGLKKGFRKAPFSWRISVTVGAGRSSRR